MSNKKLTFLFVPLEGVGHFNACFGIASVLRDRGHSVTFAAPEIWKGKIQAQGYREELYSVSSKPVKTVSEPGKTVSEPGERWGEMMKKVSPYFTQPRIEMHKHYYLEVFEELAEHAKLAHAQIQNIMERVQPDAVIVDHIFHFPAIMESEIPWIWLVSMNPLGITEDKSLPPAWSGFSTERDRKEWEIFKNEIEEIYKKLKNEYNRWLVQIGSKEKIENNFPYFLKQSPYANIYMYPLELDYNTQIVNPKFHQFDTFMRPAFQNFEIPEKLKTGPGKLVYFSIGTIGSAELNLMKKLISIFSKSSNRFIVSKGPQGDKLDLAENMWGENSVPQLAIIPIVDLVITHGGNNTITESFYFGKRVLVLPLLFDQPDNAQRIFETGLGLQFNPYKVSEQELLVAIETLLGDDLLQRRMKSISQRIQSSNSQLKAADLVEEVARNRVRKIK